MNKKDTVDKKTIVILSIILIVVLIGIFVMLELASQAERSKFVPRDKEEPAETTDPIEEEMPQVIAVSLEEIIGDINFINDYQEEISYKGLTFNFNCTEYDENSNTCTSGSGLMNIDQIPLPLYTFNKSEDSFLNKAHDYYIIINDKYIVLVTANTGVGIGEASVYNKNGEFIKKVDNVLLGYKDNDNLLTRMYPNLNNEEFVYYSCNENKVNIASVNIENNDDISILESIPTGSCY